MKCAIEFNVCKQEIIILKMLPNGTMRDICRVYEENNYLHLDARADGWKYLNELSEAYALFDGDMGGVTLKILYDWLVSRGMMDVNN